MERSIKPETLKTGRVGKLILDSRRVADRDASTEQLAGASWNDPERPVLIVRGANTDAHDLAPEVTGLVALS